MLSNVARIDYFKNIDLLVKVAIKLLQRNIHIRVIITGGTNDDERERETLFNLVPEKVKHEFLITEKLSQYELYSLFKMVKRKAVFVFTSRYETLGITPLEATLIGVCTIVPKSSLVEASRFYPEKYKFYPSLKGLENKIFEIYHNRDYTSMK